MPDGVLRVDLGGSAVHGAYEPPVSSTHMALQAWVEAKRTRDFDEADRIREVAQPVCPGSLRRWHLRRDAPALPGMLGQRLAWG